jgi:hypothetical protein
MITVRFSTGFSVQYNSMNAMKWMNDGSIALYATPADREAGKGWKVYVPKDCILEFVSPCRTYMAQGSAPDEVVGQLNALRKEVARLTRKLAKR